MSEQVREVTLSGHALLREPLLNKGAAFTLEERRLFRLEGLLPQRPVTIDVQRQRVLENLDRISDPLEKYVALASLQDRNEHLFFNVLLHRLEQLMPIVYTPTVGLATQRFSHVFQRGRGVWITPDLQGRIACVLRNAAGQRRVRLIVATDNESILGIGDQGAGGMAISIGKLALYTAAAGIDPAMVLPVSLDVGTDNENLLEDPLYLGWRERRLRGAAYCALLDEFVAAVREVFPGALVQWEDFRKDNALRVLERYRTELPSFNDDIQGTGAVALAGLLCAGRVSGRPLPAERVVILGAGAAGLGIARQIRSALRMAGLEGRSLHTAIAVLDSKGLVVENPGLVDDYKREIAWPAAAAAAAGLSQPRAGLADTVERLRPTALIGASGQPGAFTEAVVRAMARYVERPLIMPLSNPTSQAEAHPADLYRWTEGRALVAAGSPFPDVTVGNRSYRVGQGNNAFVFPAIGLATLASGAPVIHDELFRHAAEALADTVTEQEVASGLLYPSISRLREVSRAVARSILLRTRWGSPDEIEQRLQAMSWRPVYARYLPAP